MYAERETDGHSYRAQMNPAFVRKVMERRKITEKQKAEAERRRQKIVDAERDRQRREANKALDRAAKEYAARPDAEKEQAHREAVAAILAQYQMLDVIEAKVSARKLMRVVAEGYGVTDLDLMGPRRDRFIVRVRHEAIRAVADARPDMTLPQIGKVFNRDHTSVIHALRKTKKPGQAR